MKVISNIDGELVFEESFLNEKEATSLFDILKKNIIWEQKNITIYDKTIPIPRLTAWIGQDVYYAYSNIDNQPQPWTKELLELKKKIENKYDILINGCLLNLYQSGKNHISWHSDNEKELGLNPTIASVSLGSVRRFQLKHKFNKDIPKINIDTTNGSLIIMKDMQRKWLHRIAPTTKEVGERINLTFRFIYK